MGPGCEGGAGGWGGGGGSEGLRTLKKQRPLEKSSVAAEARH